MEIERKWLVAGWPPQGLFPLEKQATVHQGYIATAPTVRIRESRWDNQASYVLCFKGKGTLAREEIEMPLEPAMFEQLEIFTGSDLVRKDYRVYCLPTGHRLEVSHVDAHRPTAFFYAEVEFSSVEEANAFVPPPYLGEEKTEDSAFSMSAYWKATRGNSQP